jgi:hypothetical protein
MTRSKIPARRASWIDPRRDHFTNSPPHVKARRPSPIRRASFYPLSERFAVLHHLTSTDLLKDTLLACFGFLPTAITQADVALILGLLNLAVVIVFRLVELRRRERRDAELHKLRARVAELSSAGAAVQPPARDTNLLTSEEN